MPELPEVEVVRQGVERFVAGRTIASAEVLHPRAARRHDAGPADLEARLAGRPVTGARRRGKYLWLPLDAGEALLAHLGMSGQLIVGDPDRPYGKHLRARLTFTDDGLDLRFVDQRTFGHLMLAGLVSDAHEASARGAHGEWPPRGRGGEPADAGGVPEPIAHIAPDPLEDAFDDGAFYRELRHRHTGIKRALLNQSLISGVGNIYADEALWRARLHWARPTETLSGAEVERVLAGVREVMAAALTAGGTSFDHLYVNVNGESGYFDRLLNVYGRRDEPCERCGTPIRREAFMNRSSYSCPRCQPRPRRARY